MLAKQDVIRNAYADGLLQLSQRLSSWLRGVPMVKNISWATGGALSFWFPVIVLFALQRANVHMLVANLAAILGFLIFLAIRRWVCPSGRQSIWMLLGLYFFAPALLSVATTYANGGFAQIHGWTDIGWLLVASVFPPMQFLLAAAAGLWPSLLIVTLILVCTSVAEQVAARSAV
jgi:hypothetical protein